MFGGTDTTYLPVHPTLVVELRAEGSVPAFANRLRSSVQRLRPHLAVDDLETAAPDAGRPTAPT